MFETLFKYGYLTEEDLKASGIYPSGERMKKGPVAVCECMERIPCNPCESSCSAHAIHIGEDISDCPQVDFDACKGCCVCVAACPGLACFVVDKSYSSEFGKVSFPYEYPDVHEVGEEVDATDRQGKKVCRGKITRIMHVKSFDRTVVMTIEVPVGYVDTVRGIRLLNIS